MLWNMRRVARYSSWRLIYLPDWSRLSPSARFPPSFLVVSSHISQSPPYFSAPRLTCASHLSFNLPAASLHLSLSLHLHVFRLPLFFYPNLLYPIILQSVKSFPPYPSFPPICHTSTSSLLNHSTFVCFVSRPAVANDSFFFPLPPSLSLCLSDAAGIVRKKQWCEMVPCLEDEGCDLLVNKSGWTCTQPGGRVKTTTVSSRTLPAPSGLHNPLRSPATCVQKNIPVMYRGQSGGDSESWKMKHSHG